MQGTEALGVEEPALGKHFEFHNSILRLGEVMMSRIAMQRISSSCWKVFGLGFRTLESKVGEGSAFFAATAGHRQSEQNV